MVDAGFEVAVGRFAPDSGKRTAERLEPPGTVPASAAIDNGAVIFGNTANDRRFLSPKEYCDVFWDELSLNPSNLGRQTRALSYSELGFHFLQHLVDGLPGVATEHESLAIAVPASFLEGNGAEERIGILLGICKDLELRLATIVDVACASLFDPESTRPPRGGALVVDLGIHSANLTLVDIDETGTKRSFTRIAGSGWKAMTDLARKSFADRFLRQTSFDVSINRNTEQEFYGQTLQALRAFMSKSEAWLRVVSGSRERAVTIPRDAALVDLKPMAEIIAKAAQEFLTRQGRQLAGMQVFLSPRARQLCGLAKAMRAFGALSVTLQTNGAAARGAAFIACDRRTPADPSEVPIEDSIAFPAEDSETGGTLRSAFSIYRHPGNRDRNPTHVVIDGVVHGLRSPATVIGAGGNGKRPDLKIDAPPAGLGACEILISSVDGRWQASARMNGRVHVLPGAEAPLAPGDILEIHGAPGLARLMFVALAS